MAVTTVRLHPEIEVGLEDLAGKLQRSKSWVINLSLKEFVERQQQGQRRWEETLATVESIAQSNLIAGEDVHEWPGSWGAADELPSPKANA